MSATDTIRAMLDERGVEWRGGLPTETMVEADGLDLLYVALQDGRVRAFIRNHLTPEQAIEATLGRGECERLQDENERLRSCLSDSAENSKQILHEAHVQEEENAKLRELVRELYGELDAATQYDAGGGRGVVYEFADRMRELGVEV